MTSKSLFLLLSINLLISSMVTPCFTKPPTIDEIKIKVSMS